MSIPPSSKMLKILRGFGVLGGVQFSASIALCGGMVTGVLPTQLAQQEQLLASGVMCTTTGVLAGVCYYILSHCVTSVRCAVVNHVGDDVEDTGARAVDGGSEVAVTTMGVFSPSTITVPARSVRFAFVDGGPIPLMSVCVDADTTYYLDLTEGKVDDPDTMLGINDIALRELQHDAEGEEVEK